MLRTFPQWWLAAALAAAGLCAAPEQAPRGSMDLPGPTAFVPDFRIHPDDYTVLMAADAQLAEGLRRQPVGHGKFPVADWRRADQTATWNVGVPAEADYAVNVLLFRRGRLPVRVAVRCGAGSVSAVLPPLRAYNREWRREPLTGLLHLGKGSRTLVLQAQPTDGTDLTLDVFSIELVRPDVRDRLHRAALRARADTGWFHQARYGFMCHWTSESFPRHGERKPYAQAVQEFDVERFDDQVQQGGAGFVVFVTAHAEQYFPAPIRALEQALPGRTAQRDLVADLAGALAKRGVRLFLYYHPGSGADPKWLEACGFFQTDTARFFRTWERIVAEVGERYGSRLAGWWFDDGAISFYYRSAPWERLARAARAGNPQRLLCFNAWELPSPTEFQDFASGEGDADPAAHGWLKEGGDGVLLDGPCKGLQASACLITEGDWVHNRRDTEIGKPKWTAAEMAAMLKGFVAHRNVPIFNLEITQEGTCSPETIRLFDDARRILDAAPEAGR